MSNMGQRTPTETLIHRLRLMADAGGSLSRDRKRTCIEAADRLEELDERLFIRQELLHGGDANEKR